MADDTSPQTPARSPSPTSSAGPLARSPKLAGTILLGVAVALIVAGTVFVVLSAGLESAEVTGYVSTKLIAAIGFYFLAVPPLVAGLFARLRPPAEQDAPTWERWLALAAGGAFGLILFAFGLALSIHYREYLFKWINEGDLSNAGWFLMTVFLGILGLGVMFASAQAARPDQRANASLRRLLYGVNTFTSGCLLLLILVVINFVVRVQMPNALDTTTSGAFTLDAKTRDFIRELGKPVHAYLVMTRDENDIIYQGMRSLLTNARSAAPRDKFEVTYYSPGLDDEKIRALVNKNRQIDQVGLLLVANEGEGDRELTAFIPRREIEKVRPGAEGEPSKTIFDGQRRFITEMRFLAEDQQRPKVYFLTGHGELDINGFTPKPPYQQAARLKKFLTDRRFDLSELNLEEQESVPDDAEVVVIAGISGQLTEGEVEKLRTYLGEERDGHKGRVLVAYDTLTPLRDPQGGNQLTDGGLEPILKEYGVEVVNQFLYSLTREGIAPGITSQVNPAPTVAENPIVVRYEGLELPTGPARPVVPAAPTAAPGENKDAPRVVPLLVSEPRFPHWQQDDPSPDLAATFNALRVNATIREDKKYGNDPVPFAVLVGEEGDDKTAARLAVFGGSLVFSDAYGRGAEGATPEFYRLFADTLDWLRGRDESIGVEPVEVGEYRLNAEGIGSLRTLFLPLIVVLIAVPGMGLGVWLIRRR